MRLKALILALAIFALGAACTQRTCPTYADADVEQSTDQSK
ncbi:MAG: hypothetical protein OCD76_05545 [Reichenbachiella sp.]